MRETGLDSWLGLGTRYDAELESGQLRFDEAEAEHCLEAIRDRDCQLPAVSEAAFRRGIEFEPSCQLLRPQQSKGSCRAQPECIGSGYCRYTETSGCQGTYSSRLQEEDFAEEPEHCAPGLVAANSICMQSRAERGETCYEQREDEYRDLPCLDGPCCDSASRTCQRLGAVSDTCSSFEGRPCGNTLVCQEGHCAPRARRGEPCMGLCSGHSTCQWDLLCDADAEQPGTCEKRREAGAACRNNLECSLDSYCDEGRCLRRSREGENCLSDSGDFPAIICLPNMRCDRERNVCVPLVREGERCGPESVYETGHCSQEGRCVTREA